MEKDGITPDIFDHLVELAQLELGQDEKDYLRRELNGQLRAIRALEAIEVDPDVPITSHGVPYEQSHRPALRADIHRRSELADDIFDQAPEPDDRYFAVPDIPDEEL